MREKYLLSIISRMLPADREDF